LLDSRSAQEIWKTALGELQLQVSKPNYRTWLSKTKGITHDGNEFVIGVPNAFIAEYLDRNQRSLIEKTLIGLLNNEVEVNFQVNQDTQVNAPVKRRKSYGSSIQDNETEYYQPSLPGLNPKYTFDTFVVGSCNRMAHAAALNVIQNPGQSYNPLFLYGGVGVGKTHLLHAIGHAALAKNLQVLFMSAEQFTNDFVKSVRNRRTEEFRSKYRNLDMLLIDDVQFLCGKEQTEESFFHTFNELHNADKQIAVTCDSPPKSMPFMEDKLRSRLEWGLTTPIQSPDFDTRLSILKARAEREGVQITQDVLELIARRIHQSIRELEGSLNRVVAYSRLLKAMISPELAAEAIEDIASKQDRRVPPTPKLIAESVANSFKIDVSDIFSRKRDRHTVLARQIAMFLTREETGASLDRVGKEFGNRQPISVSQAYRKVKQDIAEQPDLGIRINNIKRDLYYK